MFPQLNRGHEITMLTNRGSWWLAAMARMKPGVSKAQAVADLNLVLRDYLAEETPGRSQKNPSMRIELQPGAWGISARSKGQAWNGLGILMALVGLLALIACANVANLLLARGATRQKEIALRLSIGAGRRRLIRQLLTESLLLSLVGGGAGLLLALWGTQGVSHLLGQDSGPSLDLTPNVHVLAFTAAISLLTAVLCGLAPALRATQLDLTPALKEASRSWGAGPVRKGLRGALLAFQVALSLVLLVVAGLFTRSLQRLLSVELGFRPEHVLLLSLDPTLIGYQDARLRTLYKALLDRVEASPGILSASLSRGGLLDRHGWQNRVAIPGYTPRPGEEMASGLNPVASHFFETAGIPILLGRDFGPEDDEKAPKVAAVNETFARDFFGTTNPVGRIVALGVNQNLGQFEIVAVVRDSKQNRLTESPVRVVYFPFLQIPEAMHLVSGMTLEVRTRGEPDAMASSVRRELLAVERNLPIFGVKTLTQQVQDSLFDQRMVATLTMIFGSLALLLASVGLYGVTAYSVSRRTNEIGVRMALGAQRAHVMRMVMLEAMALVSIGVVFGLAGSLAAGRVVSSLLYGLAPGDPVVLSQATVVLAAVAVFAAFLPARRATKVDPMVALRYE
jgi:predicted permease